MKEEGRQRGEVAGEEGGEAQRGKRKGIETEEEEQKEGEEKKEGEEGGQEEEHEVGEDKAQARQGKGRREAKHKRRPELSDAKNTRTRLHTKWPAWAGPGPNQIGKHMYAQAEMQCTPGGCM